MSNARIAGKLLQLIWRSARLSFRITQPGITHRSIVVRKECSIPINLFPLTDNRWLIV